LAFYEGALKLCKDSKEYVLSDKYQNPKKYFEDKIKKAKSLSLDDMLDLIESGELT
jgi:hypothetical protein